MPSERDATRCQWTSQADALAAFTGCTGLTQSAGHIRPLHWYVACRLVVEGGFDPASITPRPPFRISSPTRKGDAPTLHFDPDAAGSGEQTVLGGLKTKKVDVVATQPSMGPVLAVSCKGITGAFRNLTNRLEETIGECTNLHITYPALVLGYVVVLRANRIAGLTREQVESASDAEVGGLKTNDVAIAGDGQVVQSIVRFHNALSEMLGRRGIRNDLSRYESIGLGLASMSPAERGLLVSIYPDTASALRFDTFFRTLYGQYDERFVARAPDLAAVTRRHAWSPASPGLRLMNLDYDARTSIGTLTD